MSRLVLANDATAIHRRAYFDLRDETDGITPETSEAGEQPQISTNGGAFTSTGIGTLTAMGNGRYYADVTQTAIATVGHVIETRFKSANTAETPGDTFQIVAFDPNDVVRLGLTALPNAAADAAGGLPISDAGGLDMDDIPVTAEFEARTIASSDYFDPATDTVASVTLVDTTTDLTNQVAAASGTLFKKLDAVTTITVGTEAGTVANIAAVDGAIHSYEDLAGTTTFYYSKTLSVNERASSFLWNGFVQSNGDTCTVQAYDWVQAAFVTVGSVTGSNGTTVNDPAISFDLEADMTGTGADAGKVRMQFTSTTATLIATDRAWVGFASVAAEALIFSSGVAQGGGNNTIQLEVGDIVSDDDFQRAKVLIVGGTGSTPNQEAIITSSTASTDTLTVATPWSTNPDPTSVYVIIPAQTHQTVRNGGYDNSSVYFKTGGAAGTQKGVSGTTTNPSGVAADSYTIMAQEDLSTLTIRPGSLFVLPSNSSSKTFKGENSLLDFNGKDISFSVFSLVNNLTGIATGSIPAFFTLCGFASPTMTPFGCNSCAFSGTITLSGPGGTNIGGSAGINGFAPIFVLPNSASASTMCFRDWRGELVVKNMGLGGGAVTVEIDNSAHLILDSSCTAGTVNVFAPATIDLNGATGITVNRFNATVNVHQWKDYALQAGDPMVVDDTTGSDRWSAHALSLGPSGGGSNFVQGTFSWSTTITASDPGSGKLRADNATYANVTAFYISEISDTGLNIANFLTALESGDTFLANQEGSGENFLQMTVNGPVVDNDGWYTIPVSHDDSGGAIGNNRTTNVSLGYAATTANEIALEVDTVLTGTHGAGNWITSTLSAADVYTEFTTGSNEDAFKATGFNTVVPMAAALSQTEHDATQTAIGLVPKSVMEYDTGSSDGTAPKDSLYTMIHAGLHADSGTPGTLTVFETDDATTHATFTLTVDDTADHITKVAN